MSDTRVAKTFSQMLAKFNPYHDSRGRFTTAGSASFFTYAPGKSKAHDLAIAREKERMASASGANANESGFKPAKTKEEAIEYAKTKLHVEAANYGNIGLDEINHINQEITKIQEKYPELREAVRDIRIEKRESVYAAAGTGYSGQNSLYIGEKKYGKGLESVKESYQKDVDSGYHPANTDAKSIIWHEYGHIYAYTQYKTQMGFKAKDGLGYYDGIDFCKNIRSKSFEKAVIRDAAKSLKITQKELKSRISRYAEKNPAETFAEAFAEYNNSPTPRAECVAMMKAAGLAK